MPPPAQLKHFILPISHRGESREGCEDTTKEWASLLVSLSIFTQHASILARQVEMGTETQSTPPPTEFLAPPLADVASSCQIAMRLWNNVEIEMKLKV